MNKDFDLFSGDIIKTTFTKTLTTKQKLMRLDESKRKIFSSYLNEQMDKDEWLHLNELIERSKRDIKGV